MTSSKRGRASQKIPTTATQKLEYLVKKYAELELRLENLTAAMAGEVQRISMDAIETRKSLSAILEASKQGNLSFEAIDAKYREISANVQIESIKSDLEQLVQAGALTKSEDGKVNPKSFIVGRELKEDKTVSVERIQFTFDSIEEELVKERVLAASVGDLVEFGNDTRRGYLEITELYNISEQAQR